MSAVILLTGRMQSLIKILTQEIKHGTEKLSKNKDLTSFLGNIQQIH